MAERAHIPGGLDPILDFIEGAVAAADAGKDQAVAPVILKITHQRLPAFKGPETFLGAGYVSRVYHGRDAVNVAAQDPGFGILIVIVVPFGGKTSPTPFRPFQVDGPDSGRQP